MLNPDQHQKFCQFYESARTGEILDLKTTTLIGLASAMAVGCSP